MTQWFAYTIILARNGSPGLVEDLTKTIIMIEHFNDFPHSCLCVCSQKLISDDLQAPQFVFVVDVLLQVMNLYGPLYFFYRALNQMRKSFRSLK